MVNGKPTLTFGDAPYTAPATVRQRSGGNKTRNAKIQGGFESYLPVTDYSAQAKSSVPTRAGAQADGGLRQRQSAQNTAAQGTPPQSAARAMPFPLAGYPGVSQAGMSTGMAGPANRNGNYPDMPRGLDGLARSRQRALPPGGNSRAEARDTAQSQLEKFGSTRESGSSAMRLSRKTMPRFSNRPLPGRYDFGMEDTRKNAVNRNPTAARGETPASKSGAAQERNPESSQIIGRRYAGQAGRSKRRPGDQSFITNGFGGGNAERALRGLGYDLRETQPATTYARRLDSDAGVTVDSGGALSGRDRPGAFAGNGARAAAMLPGPGNKMGAGGASAYPGGSLMQAFYTMAGNNMGALAAKFESGSEGISAIGYDRKGGTSYGKYQIASRVGTMSAFIEYLEEKAPDIARRLRAAGPANTGGRSGRMPAEWRKIATEEPARFEKLQEDFIRTSHFEPAVRSISESTGLGFSNMPEALREVLFSTAVQHGPLGAVRIFNQALNNVGVTKLQSTGKAVTESFKRAGRQLIKQVYALRAGQFMSSTSGVQTAVRNRLNQEMNEALGMLA